MESKQIKKLIERQRERIPLPLLFLEMLQSIIESWVIEFIYVLNYCNYQSFELFNRIYFRPFSCRLIRDLGRVAHEPKSCTPSSSIYYYPMIRAGDYELRPFA